MPTKWSKINRNLAVNSCWTCSIALNLYHVQSRDMQVFVRAWFGLRTYSMKSSPHRSIYSSHTNILLHTYTHQPSNFAALLLWERAKQGKAAWLLNTLLGLLMDALYSIVHTCSPRFRSLRKLLSLFIRS